MFKLNLCYLTINMKLNILSIVGSFLKTFIKFSLFFHLKVYYLRKYILFKIEVSFHVKVTVKNSKARKIKWIFRISVKFCSE